MQKYRGHIGCHGATQRLELHGRRLLGGVVVVGGEAQLYFACRKAVVLGLVGIEERRGGLAFVEDAHELILEVPAVVHVETCGEVIGALTLSKHQNLALAGSLAQRVDGLFPEVGRHTVGHVAAEAVDAHVGNPELHGVDHGLAHLLVIIVQVGHVVPVPRTRMDDGVGLLIVGVPVGMFLHPRMIPRRVVGHPVEDDGHAVLVAGAGEVFEVVECSEFRRDGLVVLYAVR